MISKAYTSSPTDVVSSSNTKTASKRTNHVYKDSDFNINQCTPYKGHTGCNPLLAEDSTYGSSNAIPHEELQMCPSTASLRHGAINSQGEDSAMHGAPAIPRDKTPVPWRSLPRKDQLIILTFMRLAEPLVMTSLQAYVYFMLKSYDHDASDSVIAYQSGILTGSFTAAQCVTAVIWGRLADKAWMGRKNVLIVGLLGTFISSVGFGFSKSFVAAMLFRSLGGALNGNVGILRTVSKLFIHLRSSHFITITSRLPRLLQVLHTI